MDSERSLLNTRSSPEEEEEEEEEEERSGSLGLYQSYRRCQRRSCVASCLDSEQPLLNTGGAAQRRRRSAAGRLDSE